MNLIKNYEQIMIDIIFLSDRLKLFFLADASTSTQIAFSFASSIRRLKLFSLTDTSTSAQKIAFAAISVTTSTSNQRFAVIISSRKTYSYSFTFFRSSNDKLDVNEAVAR